MKFIEQLIADLTKVLSERHNVRLIDVHIWSHDATHYGAEFSSWCATAALRGLNYSYVAYGETETSSYLKLRQFVMGLK